MSWQQLLEKVKIPENAPRDVFSMELLEKAFRFAQNAHAGQKRLSGEPYTQHLVEVAEILADLHMDTVTIAAGLLHDVLEDTPVTHETLKREFGSEIADLVEGVTKISTRKFKDTTVRQAESMRKMLVAMAKDVRVILIKLADRTHNMRTLQYLPIEKQQRIAEETMNLYAPLAHRLGINKLKSELEDLALRYLKPEIYEELSRKIAMRREEREKLVEEVCRHLEDRLKESGLEVQVQGRPKHFTSIYRKMLTRGKSFEEILDLLAIRILTKTVRACYETLGIVHTLFKPLPGRFKDYIAMPKSNLYQSLHTTVMGPGGKPLEIQIRTFEMHRIAEEGIAAHWIYKEGRGADEDARKFAWMRQLLDLQQDINEGTQTGQKFQMDVFEEEVFVFTPKGDVKELPKGGTILDFAYSVHTDIGHQCVGARVNGEMVPLRYTLKSGDIVEILTQSGHQPSRDWLKIVKTSRARNKIRHFFRTHFTEEDVDRGRGLLEKEARRRGVTAAVASQKELLEKISADFGFPGARELCANVGSDEVSARAVFNRLQARFPELFPKTHAAPSRKKTEIAPKAPEGREAPITVDGTTEKDFLIRFARCCSPLPGDAIVGYITRGRGLSVHRADCPNTLFWSEDKERVLALSWDGVPRKSCETAVEVRAKDRDRLMADVLHVLAEEKVQIKEASGKAQSGGSAKLFFRVELPDAQMLRSVLARLEKVPGVLKAYRTELR